MNRVIFCILGFCFFGRTVEAFAESRHSLPPARSTIESTPAIMPLPSDLRAFRERVDLPVTAPEAGNLVKDTLLTEKRKPIHENSRNIDRVSFVKNTEKKVNLKESSCQREIHPRLKCEAQKRNDIRKSTFIKFGVGRFFPKYGQLSAFIKARIQGKQWDEGLTKPLIYIGIGFLILIIGPFLPLELLKILALLTGLILLGFGIYFLVLFLKDQ